MFDEEGVEFREAGAGCEMPPGALGVDVGRIVQCDGSGRVLVDCGDSMPKSARVVADLTDEQLTAAAETGREVLLAYQSGDPERPIVIALLRPQDAPARQDRPAVPIEAIVDGETVNIEAKKQIVLKCGKASITLTRAGKVLIRGAYVLSHSSGANRIKGGSVQIN